MRIIFSRKGFDQSSGGFASLIFPDGTLFSIPIPDNGSLHCYDELTFKYHGTPIQKILNEITNGKIRNNKATYACDYAKSKQGCHHDPMLLQASNRLVLGQTKSSESHLRNQGIGCNDIFLFYGWFREVEQVNGTWAYKPGARDLHVIWSCMTIHSSLRLDEPDEVNIALGRFPELQHHPHLATGWSSLPNGVYLSDKHAFLPFSKERCLTDCTSYVGRSTWRLPICFNQPQAFSFLKVFQPNGNEVVISFRGYGQEFVLNLENVRSSDDRAKILAHVQENICGCNLFDFN